jgi:hypothetical protein
LCTHCHSAAHDANLTDQSATLQGETFKRIKRGTLASLMAARADEDESVFGLDAAFDDTRSEVTTTYVVQL